MTENADELIEKCEKTGYQIMTTASKVGVAFFLAASLCYAVNTLVLLSGGDNLLSYWLALAVVAFPALRLLRFSSSAVMGIVWLMLGYAGRFFI